MTDRNNITLACAMLALAACFDSDDAERDQIVAVECDGDGDGDGDACRGLWERAAVWSPLVDLDSVLELDPVSSSNVWPCTAEPDVDACVIVDEHGRTICVWDVGDGWGAPVTPWCHVGEIDGWAPIGVGMGASVIDL